MLQKVMSCVSADKALQESEELSARLKATHFDATAFHAGMKVEDKTRVQDDFMANRVQIVVATIAFGMGVDKPDIRNIVHYTLPSTIEEYSQQVGRAGRDGKKSNCMLYLCNSDFWIRENFSRGDLPSYEPFRKLIKDIFNDEVTALRVGETFKKNTNEQMKDFDIRQSPLSVIYATLELHYNLIRAITPEYSLYSYETTMPGLYHEVMNNMKNSDRPEAAAILKYGEKKTKYTHVDVNQIVRDTGYHRANIIQILDHLDRDGAIRLTAKGVTPKFRVLQKLPKTDEELHKLAENMYADLEQKEKDALHRTREVVDLITGQKCFSQAMAQHFGMDLPDGKEECGHCMFCETGKAVAPPPKQQRPLDRGLVRQVLADCPVRDDPRFLARVAFGIMSPRVRELKMNQTSAWESMVDQDFDVSACPDAPKSSVIQSQTLLTSRVGALERVHCGLQDCQVQVHLSEFSRRLKRPNLWAVSVYGRFGLAVVRSRTGLLESRVTRWGIECSGIVWQGWVLSLMAYDREIT